jgi:hypothetical protein
MKKKLFKIMNFQIGTNPSVFILFQLVVGHFLLAEISNGDKNAAKISGGYYKVLKN